MYFASIRRLALTLLLLTMSATGQGAMMRHGFDMPDTANTTPADSAYLSGRELLAQERLDDAWNRFAKALADDPAHVYALLGQVEVSFQRRDLKTAGELMAKAMKLAPDDAHVQTVRGRLHYLNGELSRAERAFLKAQELDPGLFTARLYLADLYLESVDRAAEAASAYQGALDRFPQHAGAHFGLGRALVLLDRPDQARDAFLQAAALDPARPQPHQALADLAYRQGQSGRAMQYVREALKRDPAFAPSLMAKGDLLQARGDLAGAKQAYAAALQQAPGRVSTQFRMAALHQRLGEHAQAIDLYRRVVRADAKAAAAHNNLAWLLVQTDGDLDEARRAAEQATRLAPRAVPFKHTLAWVYRARGDADDAEALLEQITRQAPDAGSYHYHLGMVRQELGDKSGARRAFRAALAGNPFPEADDARARLRALGDP